VRRRPIKRRRSTRSTACEIRPTRQPGLSGWKWIGVVQNPAFLGYTRGAESSSDGTDRGARAVGSSAAVSLLQGPHDRHRDVRALQPAAGATRTAAISREDDAVIPHGTTDLQIAALLRSSTPLAPQAPERPSNGPNRRPQDPICGWLSLRKHPHARPGCAIQLPIPTAPASPKP